MTKMTLTTTHKYRLFGHLIINTTSTTYTPRSKLAKNRHTIYFSFASTLRELIVQIYDKLVDRFCANATHHNTQKNVKEQQMLWSCIEAWCYVKAESDEKKFRCQHSFRLKY